MTVQIGDIVRAVLTYSHPYGSLAQTVFTFELQDDAVDESDMLADLATWAETVWGQFWADLSDEVCFLELIEVDILNGDGTVAVNIGAATIDLPGDNVGEVASAGVAGYLQAESERIKSLGKKYVPFITESAITDGQFTVASVAVLAQLFGVYIDPLVLTVVGTLVPGVLSRVTESFQEFTGTGYTTDIPAYQRRRKPNVGS